MITVRCNGNYKNKEKFVLMTCPAVEGKVLLWAKITPKKFYSLITYDWSIWVVSQNTDRLVKKQKMVSTEQADTQATTVSKVYRHNWEGRGFRTTFGSLRPFWYDLFLVSSVKSVLIIEHAFDFDRLSYLMHKIFYKVFTSS